MPAWLDFRGYAATDMDLDESKFVAARAVIIKSGLIVFDDETDELFIPNWYMFNAPHTEKHIIGIRNCLERIESQDVLDACETELDEIETQINKTQQKAAEKKLAKESAGKKGLGVVNGSAQGINKLTSAIYK